MVLVEKKDHSSAKNMDEVADAMKSFHDKNTTDISTKSTTHGKSIVLLAFPPP
jgi:hypothetical protein